MYNHNLSLSKVLTRDENIQAFSVLMSIYKKENPDYLREALMSVVSQTIRPSEIVLVKDGPLTSKLEEVIDSFLKDFPNLFKVVGLPKNEGLGNALRHGLLSCSNELVARMDTDDICHPRRFEKQINFLKRNPEIDILGTTIEEFNQVPGDLKSFRVMPLQGKELIKYSKYRNPVNHPSVFFKKSSVLECGGYNGDILLFEDFALFIRMLVEGKVIYNLPEALLYFRVGSRIENIKRRSGLHYVKSELKFSKYAYEIGHLSFIERIIYIIAKVPIRLLPPKWVLLIYTGFLRK